MKYLSDAVVIMFRFLNDIDKKGGDIISRGNFNAVYKKGCKGTVGVNKISSKINKFMKKICEKGEINKKSNLSPYINHINLTLTFLNSKEERFIGEGKSGYPINFYSEEEANDFCENVNKFMESFLGVSRKFMRSPSP